MVKDLAGHTQAKMPRGDVVAIVADRIHGGAK